MNKLNSLQDIVEKIKKLLLLSESSNENEAALAAAKAAELMLKYSISQSSLHIEEDKEDVEFFIFEDNDKKNKVQWKGGLAYSIAEFFNCFVYWSNQDLYFIGRESDKNAVLYLYKAISNQIEELAYKFWVKEGIRSGIHGKSWNNSFKLGCVINIANRFKDKKKEIFDEFKRENTDLTVYNSVQRQVLNKKQELSLKQSPVKASSKEAFISGTIAGNSVNIGDNKGINRTHHMENNSILSLENKV